MLLDLSKALREPGQPFPIGLSLTLPPMDVLDDPVQFESVAFSGVMVGAGESVSIEGSVTSSVTTRCALCLEGVSFPIQAKVKEVFTRESTPDDPDTYPIDGTMVDVEPVIRDALLLELPMRIVCAEDCKGLCPSCGINRNKERCTCQEGGERLNPFSALSELLSKDEEV